MNLKKLILDFERTLNNFNFVLTLTIFNTRYQLHINNKL